MYYRSPSPSPEQRKQSDRQDSVYIPVPENYSGNVFRTSGGRTSFSPPGEEELSPMFRSGESLDDLCAPEESPCVFGTSDPEEPETEDRYFGGDDDSEEYRNSGEHFHLRDDADPDGFADTGEGDGQEDDPGKDKRETDPCASGDRHSGKGNVPPPSVPHSLPRSPKFLEYFSLPQNFGSEELLLLGLMYLTSQKPGDDLWLYLLILLFCGE